MGYQSQLILLKNHYLYLYNNLITWIEGTPGMDSAELELGIFPANEGSYTLNFRFWRPGSSASITLGPPHPGSISIDPSSFRGLMADPKAYGEALSQTLFIAPGAKEALAQARAVAEALNVPLRFRLFIPPSAPRELHTLRWETLADPGGSSLPLAMSENLLFSRFSSSDNRQPFSPAQRDQLRALIVIANPNNLSQVLEPLDVPKELERARTGLEGMEIFELPSNGKATLENLLERLREGVDVLYLVAHGGLHKQKQKTYLLLEKPDGIGHPVFTEDFVSRLSELPLVAVLVSCLSAGTDADPLQNPMVALGPALAQRGVPAVVAMQGRVTFSTMNDFLPTFFKELQRDGYIDRAVAAARARVGERPDWWMPALFSRLQDNRVLLPPQSAQPLEVEWFEPETVIVPAGKFIMGRDPAPGVPVWETPAHEVDLPAYRIGKYPVTNRQYAEFIRQSKLAVNLDAGWIGQNPPPDAMECPVAGVTWYEAVEYCAWLSEKTGRQYALPSEAQWEKAARGQKGTLYPWGEEWQADRCNSQLGRITAVNAYPEQGPYGCFDLVGNVREWTLSLWGDRRSEPDPRFAYPWTDDERNDPRANSLIRRIYRGGAAEKPSEMTCTTRGAFAPDKSGPPGKRHGLRVVMQV